MASVTDPSIKAVRLSELWAAWPREGRSAFAKALGGQVHCATSGAPRRSPRPSLPGAHTPRTAFPTPPHACPKQVADVLGRVADDSPIRLSSALNHSGHPVLFSTAFTGEDVTDAAGFKFMPDPGELHHMLERKLGKPHNLRSREDVVGRRGIVFFERPKSLHGAAGAFDLFDGTSVAASGTELWSESEAVRMWPLP